MNEIVAGKTYQRTDIEGAVTKVHWVGNNGDVVGHTYVPGGTMSSACATMVDSLKTRIVEQD